MAPRITQHQQNLVLATLERIETVPCAFMATEWFLHVYDDERGYPQAVVEHEVREFLRWAVSREPVEEWPTQRAWAGIAGHVVAAAHHAQMLRDRHGRMHLAMAAADLLGMLDLLPKGIAPHAIWQMPVLETDEDLVEQRLTWLRSAAQRGQWPKASWPKTLPIPENDSGNSD